MDIESRPLQSEDQAYYRRHEERHAANVELSQLARKRHAGSFGGIVALKKEYSDEHGDTCERQAEPEAPSPTDRVSNKSAQERSDRDGAALEGSDDPEIDWPPLHRRNARNDDVRPGKYARAAQP